MITLAVLSISSGNVSATVISNCTLTGYTFMGGSGAYESLPEGSNTKDYFLGQSLYYDYGGVNFYGYGWAEFIVGDETIDSAYLVFDLIGVGAMGTTDASAENPAYVDIYSAGDHDVSELDTDSELRAELQAALYGTESLTGSTLIITSNGTYSVDITDLYNDAVTAELDSIGLVFSAPDNMSGNGGKFASFGNADGSAPYISDEVGGGIPVPEPATTAILGLGALAFRRKRSA